MKKLDIINGGHPRSNDDLIHLQEGLTETLSALNGALATDANGNVQNCILWGLNQTFVGGNLIVTEGAVLLGGEVCLYPEQNLGNTAYPPGYNHILKRVDSFAASNPVVYASAASHSPHVITTAVINVIQATPAADEMIWGTNALRLKDIIRTNTLAIDTWHTVGAAGEPTLNSNYSSQFMKFRKSVNDMVLLAFNAINMSHWVTLGSVPDVHTSTEKLITLPVGYRPSFVTTMVVPMDMNVYPQEVLAIRIEVNGDIFIGVTAAPPTGLTPGTFNNRAVSFNTMFNAI